MKQTKLIIISFACISFFIFYDLFLDVGANAHAVHVVFELAVGLCALGWMIYFFRRYYNMIGIHKKISTEAEEWRQKATLFIEGLGSSIDEQFDVWQLTATEKEIALLLVKGLSTKEIATVRQGSERTVRQHAQAIYAKANLAGRAELAAYFLEDLLSPREK